MILRRLGVESLYLAHQARPVDASLLLEIAALTTNRLVALLGALPAGRLTRKGFFERMYFEVSSHRERDATWWERVNGLQSLIAAQRKIDQLEESILPAGRGVALDTVYRSAVGCAVYIAFFLEAWRRCQQEGRNV